MRRAITFISLLAVATITPASVVLGAPNPSGQGLPNQSCQDIEILQGGTTPGQSSSSPGSPFNEAGINSQNGGIGGQHYDAAGAPSQYDVACYQVSQR